MQPPLPGPGQPGANPMAAPGGMGTPQIPDMQKMLMAENGVGAEGVEMAGATEIGPARRAAGCPAPGPGALYGAPTVPEASRRRRPGAAPALGRGKKFLTHG